MTVTIDQTRSAKARPCDTSDRSSDFTGLARGALARLRAEMQGPDRPHDSPLAAREVLGEPCAAAMAYALCDIDDMAASVLVEDLLDAGLSVQDVCLDHLAPAARHLGDLWDRDRLPFTEVALATARIQALLRRMPPGRSRRPAVAARGRSLPQHPANSIRWA